jgi:hypothetical protein
MTARHEGNKTTLSTTPVPVEREPSPTPAPPAPHARITKPAQSPAPAALEYVTIRVPLGPPPRHPPMGRVDAHYTGRRALVLARITAGVSPLTRLSDKLAVDCLLDLIAEQMEGGGP